MVVDSWWMGGRNKRNRNKSHRGLGSIGGFGFPVEIKEARSCFRNRSYLAGYLGCPGMKSRGGIGEA